MHERDHQYCDEAALSECRQMSLGILRLIICRPVSTLSQPNLALALLIVLLCPACFHVLSTVLLVSYRRVNRGR